jgi:hypothetical protein
MDFPVLEHAKQLPGSNALYSAKDESVVRVSGGVEDGAPIETAMAVDADLKVDH